MDSTGKPPLISVIVPAYNAVATLRRTLASVLNQTHAHLELWVIDDGSTDGTAAMVEKLRQEWQDDRLLVASFENSGQATARNRGLELSQGSYVAFLDADDTWTPTKLADQLAALMENPNAAVAYSWTDYVDDDGIKLHRGSYVALSGRVLAALVVVNFLENGSNPLVRREAIAQVGNFTPELVPSEDWDLWLRLAEQFEFVAVPEVQILYRVSLTSQSANVRRLERSCMACLNRAFDRNIDDLEVQANRRQSFGNIYKYLLHKALDGPVNANRKQNWSRFKLALWLFLNLIWFCPLFLVKRLTIKIFARLLLLKLNSFFSMRKSLLDKLSNATGVDALLGYIQLPKSS
ncbi:MAG: glycosyltransferase family 2 protein [Cyanobacteria bacterium P01_D01_bin.73]